MLPSSVQQCIRRPLTSGTMVRVWRRGSGRYYSTVRVGSCSVAGERTMWFRRFIAWVRARFSASLIDDAGDLTETRDLPFAGVMPPYEPEFTRRQLFYPRDQLR